MKRPSFQFYPGDWQANSNLRRCTHAEKGVWMDILCLLHDQIEYGVLRWSTKEIAQAIGASPALVRTLVSKGVMKGDDKKLSEPLVYIPRSGRKNGEPVILVPEQLGPIWYSSRMVRDEYVRTIRGESTRFGVRDGEAPNGTPKRTLGDGSSSSSSPSPSPSERKNQLDLSSAAIPDTARAVEPPAAPPPGFDPRFRDVQIRVQALLNSPALTSFGLVDKWLKAGAEPEIDIYPTLQGRRDRWNGRTLAYFDEAVLDAVKTRTTPAGTNAASISLPPYSEAERGEKQWVFRVKSFREHGTWLDQWGPTPDEPGCRAPASARAA
jgi:hypothetical protein